MTPWRTRSRNHQAWPVVQLQCGHGDDAVENPESEPVKVVDMRRFNAATAMTPWRTRGSPATGRAGRRCFNAATAMTPWRTGDDRASPARGGCFNAATAMTPWRTQLPSAYRRPRRGLQCGHGDDAVEN